MRKLAILTTATVAALALGTTPAQATSSTTSSSLRLQKCNSSNRTSCAYRNINKGQTTLTFLRRHKNAGTKKSRTAVARSARYLIRYGQLQLRQARPAHYYGWLCIHRREAAWNDAGSPYYGGLQMSWNWMGAVPGGDAGKLSSMQQMWIAERVSARQGFTYDWMKGQWPNTYPPCASYF